MFRSAFLIYHSWWWCLRYWCVICTSIFPFLRGSLIRAWPNWVKLHHYGGLLRKSSNTEGSEVDGNTIIECPSKEHYENDIIYSFLFHTSGDIFHALLSQPYCLKLNVCNDGPQQYSQSNTLLFLLSSSDIIVNKICHLLSQTI